MVNATLHYFYDPLCGWCYAAAPLLQAAAAQPGLRLRMHAGGMMSGTRSQTMHPQLRDYVMAHDRRIQSLSGQPFGDAYFNGLLRDETTRLDSTPPTRAILAAAALGASALAMLHAIQSAHYVAGRKVAEPEVLLTLAQTLGLAVPAFATAMQQVDFAAHVDDTLRWMERFGLRGFPSLLLEQGGEFLQPDYGAYLGRDAAFVQYLQNLLDSGTARQAAGPACTPEGCR